MFRKNKTAIKILSVITAGMLLTASTGLPVMAAAQSTQTPQAPPSGDKGGQGGPGGQGGQDGQTPPDMPQGGTMSGNGAPDGAPGGGTMSGNAAPGGQGGPGGGQSAVTSWAAANEITSDTNVNEGTYSSTGTDENAIHVTNSANAVFTNLTVTRNSSDSTGGDNSSFYGVGAAVLTTSGTTTVNSGSITTDAPGAAGLFSYDTGVTYAKNLNINTTQNTSGGIHVAGGGTMYAWDLNVNTNGESAAAIRSDRGGGTMRVNGGTYTSNGVGSPAVYCTADIAVNNATLTANGSEGLCLEGLNTARLFDSSLTSNMSDDSQNDTTWSAIIYQSMSGDSQVGKGTFDMIGGSFTSKNGGLLYTTNTESDILMSNVAVTMADDAEFFLRCTGNNNQRGWGTAGDNGADCNFTADSQEMNGDIIYDSISNLDFYMTNGSTLNGAIVDDESCAGNGGDGAAKVYIDKSSAWTVTGDSTVTDLYNAGTIKDADGKTVTVKGTDGTTYVDGDSEYTVTVTKYSEDADMSGALAVPAWSDYEVTEPTLFTTADITYAENGSAASEEATAAQTADAASDNKDSSAKSNVRLIAGIAVAAAAVVAGLIVALTRKRKE